MRKLSEAEILSINKLLHMETSAITKSRVLVPAIDDQTLKGVAEASVLSCEARIKLIQQFINENAVIAPMEVN